MDKVGISFPPRTTGIGFVSGHVQLLRMEMVFRMPSQSDLNVFGCVCSANVGGNLKGLAHREPVADYCGRLIAYVETDEGSLTREPPIQPLYNQGGVICLLNTRWRFHSV